MIRGMHAMFYSSKAEELRAFLRHKLRLRGKDVGGGWLIFGFVTYFRVAGDFKVQLYQPKYGN